MEKVTVYHVGTVIFAMKCIVGKEAVRKFSCVIVVTKLHVEKTPAWLWSIVSVVTRTSAGNARTKLCSRVPIVKLPCVELENRVPESCAKVARNTTVTSV